PVDRRFHESDFAVEIFQQRRAGRKHPGQRRHRVAQEILHQVRRRLSARRNAAGAGEEPGGGARKKRGEKGLNQLLDNILERPPAQKLAILAATIILLGALYYSFIYSPQADEIAKLADSVEIAHNEKTVKTQKAANWVFTVFSLCAISTLSASL